MPEYYYIFLNVGISVVQIYKVLENNCQKKVQQKKIFVNVVLIVAVVEAAVATVLVLTAVSVVITQQTAAVVAVLQLKVVLTVVFVQMKTL